MKYGYGPPPVMALETKEEVGKDRSADYYAQANQVRTIKHISYFIYHISYSALYG